jgi:hypothetical protein
MTMQTPELTSQQLTLPLAAGQELWQSWSEWQLVVHVPEPSSPEEEPPLLLLLLLPPLSSPVGTTVPSLVALASAKAG